MNGILQRLRSLVMRNRAASLDRRARVRATTATGSDLDALAVLLDTPRRVETDSALRERLLSALDAAAGAAIDAPGQAMSCLMERLAAVRATQRRIQHDVAAFERLRQLDAALHVSSARQEALLLDAIAALDAETAQLLTPRQARAASRDTPAPSSSSGLTRLTVRSLAVVLDVCVVMVRGWLHRYGDDFPVCDHEPLSNNPLFDLTEVVLFLAARQAEMKPDGPSHDLALAALKLPPLFSAGRSYAGKSDFLCMWISQRIALSDQESEDLVEAGRAWVNGAVELNPWRLIRSEDDVRIRSPARVDEPEAGPRIA